MDLRVGPPTFSHMNLLAAVAELPGRTVEVGGVSIWDPARFIVLALIVVVMLVGAVVIHFLERRDKRNASARRQAAIYRDSYY